MYEIGVMTRKKYLGRVFAHNIGMLGQSHSYRARYDYNTRSVLKFET